MKINMRGGGGGGRGGGGGGRGGGRGTPLLIGDMGRGRSALSSKPF